MTLGPESMLQQLEDVTSKPTEAVGLLDKWAKKLEDTLVPPFLGEDLCLLGRGLTVATLLASLDCHAGLWDEQRSDWVMGLLAESASIAAKGQVDQGFRDNIIRRPRLFMQNLQRAYEGNESANKFLRRVAAKYREAIEEGQTVPSLL